MTTIKVLTIWQPWAWLIAKGFKDVENRGWPTRYRGTVLIHAGKRWREREVEEVLDDLVERKLIPAKKRPSLDELRAQCGKVIAKVQLTGCVPSTGHRSPWAIPGGFAFEIGDVDELDEPIAMTGQRGLVAAPAEVVAQLRRGKRGAA